MTSVPKSVWIGRGISLLPILMFTFSAVMKFFPTPESIQGLAHAGIPETAIMTIAFLEILSLVLYAIPRTAVIGAILLTGYLGGAIFAHVRIGEQPFIQFALGIMVWGGLYLRDKRLQSLIPLRKNI